MNENINNPRNFWKSIKSVIPNKSDLAGTTSVPFLKDELTELEYSKCASKSNIFCSYFSSIASHLKTPIFQNDKSRMAETKIKTHKNNQ